MSKRVTDEDYKKIKDLITILAKEPAKYTKVATFVKRDATTVSMIHKSTDIEHFRQIMRAKNNVKKAGIDVQRPKLNGQHKAEVPEWVKLINNNLLTLNQNVERLLEELKPRKSGWFK